MRLSSACSAGGGREGDSWMMLSRAYMSDVLLGYIVVSIRKFC